MINDANNDTIVAQATPPGCGSVGILRISGNRARAVAEAVLGRIPHPRYVSYLPFKDENGTVLDQGIALWFPRPNSFTGEDVLELQGHCNPIVFDLLLKRILLLSGVRIARPGEFSERAFLNEKIDLVQAEAIADLIAANSEQAARSALQSLNGAFSDRINHLLEMLTLLRINIEASINFPEEKIDFLSEKEIENQLDQVIRVLCDVRTEAFRGAVLNEGMKIVIAGPPNVGKSSLLNFLSGRDAAIVTDVAGTTRDVLREHIHIDGMPFHIMDTAGLCKTNDKVERIGVERAWKTIEESHRILFVVDTIISNLVDTEKIFLNFRDRIPKNIPVTIIRNKIDLTKEKGGYSSLNGYSLICLSARTGEGVDILRKHLKNTGFGGNTEGVFLARRRHLQALEKAEKHLLRSKEKLIERWNDELFIEELRLAHCALGEITGVFSSDRLLKEIFSNFCIGK